MKIIKTNIMLALFCGLNYAQNNNLDGISEYTNFLDEVVVTDSRFLLKRSQSGKTVIKIKTEEIERFSGLGLGVLLSTHLGIDLIGKNMYSGQNLTFSIRGGRNRQVLILIDGVRISDPSSIDNDFDINSINIDMIQSIEIVKGATSSLYGSSAATGVVNITTKKPESSIALTFKKNWGIEQPSNQPLKKINAAYHLINLTGTFSKIGINLTLAERFSNGLSAVLGDELDSFNKKNFSIGLNGKIIPKLSWRFTLNIDEILADYDNKFPLEDADFQYFNKLNRLAINTKYDYEKGSLNLNLGFQQHNRDYKDSFLYNYSSENLNIDLFNKYIFNTNLYSIIGIQYQKSRMKAANDPMDNQTDIYMNSVYLHPSGLNINTGFRYNLHKVYGGHLIYSLNPSLSFDINQDHKLKLITSYSKAFISPSLFQLYDLSYGNINLEPEKNLSFELGFEIIKIKNLFSALIFERNENPTLIYDNSPKDGYPYGRYSNSENMIVYRGFELGYNFNIFHNVKTRSNYIYTETSNGDLRGIPNHTFSTIMDVSFTDFTNLNLISQYTGRRLANDNQTELEAYSLFTFLLNHELERLKTDIYFSIFNIFDKDYQVIPQYSSRGRNILIGIKTLLN